jgi:hypothetical protein
VCLALLFVSFLNLFVNAEFCRYGVSKQDEAFNAELCDLYSR